MEIVYANLIDAPLTELPDLECRQAKDVEEVVKLRCKDIEDRYILLLLLFYFTTQQKTTHTHTHKEQERYFVTQSYVKRRRPKSVEEAPRGGKDRRHKAEGHTERQTDRRKN